MRKKIVGVAATILVLTLIYGFKGKDRQFIIAKNMDIFSSLFKEINQYYVDDVNPNTLMNKGLKSMLESLDPYTVYIPEDQIENYRINNDGAYVGIGALTSKVKKNHYVMMTYPGYPAHEAGLKIGDKVLTVDGKAIGEKSDEELSKLVKGQENTVVVLKVERYGKEDPFDLSITRKRVEINSVSYAGLITDDIGYAKLSQFSANCSQHVMAALEKVKGEGANSLVLDLRGNPGGFLHEAVNVCNLFIPKGEKVVDTKGKNPVYTRTYETLNEPMDQEIPLAILIDEKSASASEIVSGVMQDYDRGILVGERSFGKGLVQKTWKLPYNGQLKGTISKYYIPSGRCIQALDYSHKSKDGNAVKIVDSLRTTFYTNKKREVFDGGGINPDTTVVIDNNRTEFVKYVINEGYIIDYTNKYVYDHEQEAPKEDFVLSDEEYNLFSDWLIAKGFEYNSSAVVLADTLIDRLTNKNNEMANEFQVLKSAMKGAVSRFLKKEKESLKAELSRNIISRYYYEEGLVKYSLSQDDQLDVAITLLQNKDEMGKLLKQ